MFAIALALALTPSIYRPKMTSELYPECKAGIKAIEDVAHATRGDEASATACLNYLQGVIEMRPDKVWRCSHNLTALGAARAIVKFVDEKPYYIKADAVTVVMYAIDEDFQCQPSK